MSARLTTSPPAAMLLNEVLRDLSLAGVQPSPLTVLAACSDKTEDSDLIAAVAREAEQQACGDGE